MGRENIIKPPAEFAQEVSGFPYQDVHEKSATQRYMIGARYHDVQTGKSWRYGKSSAACYAGRGAVSLNRMANEGLDYSLLSGTQAIGDKEVTFVGGTHPIYTKDQLQGGMILISDDEAGVPSPTDADPQNRTIIGNDAAAANAALRVDLDRPLTRATSALTYAFLLPNPYAKVQQSTDAGWNAWVAGVPGLYVDAADYYLWLQTWGPVWCAFQSDLSTKAYLEMEAVWRWDGSLTVRDDAAPAAHAHAQVAGYVLDAGSSACFIQLTMAP